MARSAKELKQARIEKMRLGQAACEITTLPSDESQRVALVPLTQGEYLNSLSIAAALPVEDNVAGRINRDELQRTEILAMACREVNDLTARYYQDGDAVRELEAHDINHLFDVYLEMVAAQNPSQLGMTEEDFTDLKKALPSLRWSEFSGQQWYAAQRFLNSIQEQLLMVNLPGSPATSKSTTMSIEEGTMTDVGRITSSPSVTGVESPS